jgi:hypothetical protein
MEDSSGKVVPADDSGKNPGVCCITEPIVEETATRSQPYAHRPQANRLGRPIAESVHHHSRLLFVMRYMDGAAADELTDYSISRDEFF